MDTLHDRYTIILHTNKVGKKIVIGTAYMKTLLYKPIESIRQQFNNIKQAIQDSIDHNGWSLDEC